MDERRTYDRTAMEDIVAALRIPTNILLAAVPLAVLAAVVWVTGQLGERILASFSAAAGKRFPNEYLGGAPVWLGDNFGNLIKTALWTAGAAMILKRIVGAFVAPSAMRLAGPLCVVAAAAVCVALGLVSPVLSKLSLIWPLVVLAAAAADRVSLESKAPAVALREFKALMLNPLGWGVLAGFSIVLALLFVGAVEDLTVRDARGVLQPIPETAPAAGQPLTAFFSSRVLSFGFLILIPIITMRLVSEEKRSGTVEVLLTSPVREWNVILGKFLGAFGFYVVMWSLSLVHLWLLDQIGTPDSASDPAGAIASAAGLSVGQIAGAYLGLMLIGAGFLAMGLFFSCLVGNQLAAAVLTLLGLLLFTFQGFVKDLPTAGTWAWVGQAADYLDLRRHLEWSARGTPDSRTVFLFLSITGLFLFLAVRALESRRWNDMNLGRFGLAVRSAAGLLVLALVGAVGWIAFSAQVLDKSGATGVWAALPIPVWVWPVGLLTLAALPAALFFRGLAGVLPAVAGAVVLAGWLAWTLSRAAPEQAADFDYSRAAVWAAIAGIGAMAAALVVVPRLAVRSLSDKLVSGANVAVCSLAGLVIGIMVNYLAVQYHVYLDWSPEEAFTLRPESVAALAGLSPDQKPAVQAAADLIEPLAAEYETALRGDPAAFAAMAKEAAGKLRGLSAASEARNRFLWAAKLMSEAGGKAGNDAEIDRAEARKELEGAKLELQLLLPAAGAAIADGETVECTAFVGRYDPPKGAAEINDNFRRDTLERLFRRYADSLNRPGNVKFRYEFVNPRDDRDAGKLAEFRNRYGVEGNREILLRIGNRHFIVNDDELFVLDLTSKRFREIVGRWRREFEQGRHTAPPPAVDDDVKLEQARAMWKRPKSIPPEYAEYAIPEEDWELTTHRRPDPTTPDILREDIEEIFTNALLRVVKGQLNILYFTQGHREREVFPEADGPTARPARPAGPAGPLDDPAKETAAAAARNQRKIEGARRALQRRNFQVRVLNAAETKGGADVPADASALVIVDPMEDFLPAEIDSVERYLKRGGKLVLMLDPRGGAPGVPRPIGKPGEPGEPLRPEPKALLALAARHGVIFDDSVAVLRQFSRQRGEGAPQTGVYLVSAPLKAPGNPEMERVYNEVLLAKPDRNSPIIREWVSEGERQNHPLFPGVMFHEIRPVKGNGQAKFSPIVGTGQSAALEGAMLAWGKIDLGRPTLEPQDPTDPSAGGITVMASVEPQKPGDGNWRIVALGDSEWCSDVPLGGPPDEADARRETPTYLSVWLRGGERLLLALMRDLCRPPAALAVKPKSVRPFRAAVQPPARGVVLAGFRPDMDEQQVRAVVESVRKAAKGRMDLLAETLSAEPHDLRRIYEIRLPKDADVASAAEKLRGLPEVREVRDSSDAGALLVEFHDGTPPAKVAAAVGGLDARDTPRTVRNQWRLTFDRGLSVVKVEERLLLGRSLELTDKGLEDLKAALPAAVHAKLAKMAIRKFESKEKMDAAIVKQLSGAEALAHKGAILDAAKWDLEEVRPVNEDLLLRAGVIHWAVLPGLLLAMGLAVHLVRRWE